MVAADISAPSLEKARILAVECGLEDRISLRLGSGLGVLEPEEAQGALLLGMGGELIARILEEAPDIAGKLTLVLQPMQHGDRLRAYLRSRGYAILDEALVREGRRIHEMMKVRRAAGALPERTDGMPDEIGPLLWQRRDPLLAERLRIRAGGDGEAAGPDGQRGYGDGKGRGPGPSGAYRPVPQAGAGDRGNRGGEKLKRQDF